MKGLLKKQRMPARESTDSRDSGEYADSERQRNKVLVVQVPFALSCFGNQECAALICDTDRITYQGILQRDLEAVYSWF